MRFSQRYGYTPIRSTLQVESMDDDLRVGLWNVLYSMILEAWSRETFYLESHQYIITSLWVDLLRLPVDTMPRCGRDALADVRKRCADAIWHRVYDLIEFFCQAIHHINPTLSSGVSDACNGVLKREMSAWRIVGRCVVRLTSEEEIAAVEEAECLTGKFAPGAFHIQRAVANLADRQNRDARTSIKESISAVEAVCRIATGQNSLGAALRALRQTGIILHPAIQTAFDKLYGYTSDAHGIRHAHLDSGSVDTDDAMFMVVVCSAFVNLVRVRAPDGAAWA